MRSLLTSVILVAGLAAQAAHAAPIRIDDHYVGADAHGWGDRIGTAFFEVDHMNVDFSGDIASVTVYTNYKNPDSRALGTTYGDLFISNNGWHPFGSSADGYKNDNYTNGESWEFVFDTSENCLYGGGFSIKNSFASGTFRNGQEVLRAKGGECLYRSPVAYGTAVEGGHTWQTITYQFDWTLLGVSPGSEIGWRWQMTCANDVIEGATPTPERPNEVPVPGSAALLLVGLAALRRRFI